MWITSARSRSPESGLENARRLRFSDALSLRPAQSRRPKTLLLLQSEAVSLNDGDGMERRSNLLVPLSPRLGFGATEKRFGSAPRGG